MRRVWVVEFKYRDKWFPLNVSATRRGAEVLAKEKYFGARATPYVPQKKKPRRKRGGG